MKNAHKKTVLRTCPLGKKNAFPISQNIKPKTIIKSARKSNKKFAVTYNTDYAMKVHEAEHITRWSEPGSGPKYLETKVVMFMRKYIGIVVDSMRRVLR